MYFAGNGSFTITISPSQAANETDKKIVCLCEPKHDVKSIIWYRCGKEIDNTEAKYTIDLVTPALTIKDFTTYDTGNYSCTIENGFGVTSSSNVVQLEGTSR